MQEAKYGVCVVTIPSFRCDHRMQGTDCCATPSHIQSCPWASLAMNDGVVCSYIALGVYSRSTDEVVNLDQSRHLTHPPSLSMHDLITFPNSYMHLSG